MNHTVDVHVRQVRQVGNATCTYKKECHYKCTNVSASNHAFEKETEKTRERKGYKIFIDTPIRDTKNPK